VKIDLLGNRSLAVIRDALLNLEEEGVHIDARLWRPADDVATVAALARGDSLGVFCIESSAMRQLQRASVEEPEELASYLNEAFYLVLALWRCMVGRVRKHDVVCHRARRRCS